MCVCIFFHPLFTTAKLSGLALTLRFSRFSLWSSLRPVLLGLACLPSLTARDHGALVLTPLEI